MFMKFIIPCYNVGDTIGRMLDSILSQTFTDYHIVCVEDCSTDNTWEILQKYGELNPDKITLLKNPKNLGAGASRNRGYDMTIETLQSEFIWMVDGDDYIADDNVLEDIYGFVKGHGELDMINIGFNFCSGYHINCRLNWPAPWTNIIRTVKYVHFLDKNIHCEDVYQHFITVDVVDDDKIGNFNRLCYVVPQAGLHKNTVSLKQNIAREIGLGLMEHVFRKPKVVELFMSDKGKWIKRCFKEFELKHSF